MVSQAAILVTGMSGVGKSTALGELSRRGFATVDTDDGKWIHVADGEPLWREPRIQALLDQPRDEPLFVVGTVANQGLFYPQFDAIVLLSAPAPVVFDRLARRTNNPFGKTPAERERIADDIAHVEPLLRQSATHEIDTTRSPAEVADALADIARTAARRATSSPADGGVVIRFALPSDATALSRLALRSKGYWGYDTTFLEACRAELDVAPSACDGAHVIVAVDGAAVVGFARLAGEPPEGELVALFVDPPFMKRGVGGALLRTAMVQAYTLGMGHLLIDSDPGAEGFYLRAGAQRVGSTESGSIPGRLLPRLRLDVNEQ